MADDPFDLVAIRRRLQQFVQRRWDDLTWQEVELLEDVDTALLIAEAQAVPHG